MEKETLAVIGSMAAAILVLAQIIRGTLQNRQNRRDAAKNPNANPREALTSIKEAIDEMRVELGAKIDAVGKRVEDIWERG